MFEKLIECNLFKGVSENEILKLKETIHYQVKNYNKEELVISGGEECINLLIVIEGSVRGEMTDFNGKTIKIEDIEAYRPLAPAFLFGNNNNYPVTIVANNNCKILIIAKPMVLKLFQLNEIVLANYLNNISNRTQFLSQKLKFLSFQSIKGKFANYILSIAGDKLKSVELKVNQVQMAELFGVTRPALARAIRELDKEEVITANGKLITIVDKARLASYLNK